MDYIRTSNGNIIETVDKIPEDAKPTYVEGVYVTPSSDIYYFDNKHKKYRKAKDYKVNKGFTRRIIDINGHSYIKSTLFAQAFVENPYKDTDIKYVALPIDGNYNNLVPENFKWITFKEAVDSRYEICPICKKNRMIKGHQCCGRCKDLMSRNTKVRERKYVKAVDKINYIYKYLHTFTEVERETLQYYAKGYTIAEIGNILGKSRQAVFATISNLMEKAKNIEDAQSFSED